MRCTHLIAILAITAHIPTVSPNDRTATRICRDGPIVRHAAHIHRRSPCGRERSAGCQAHPQALAIGDGARRHPSPAIDADLSTRTTHRNRCAGVDAADRDRVGSGQRRKGDIRLVGEGEGIRRCIARRLLDTAPARIAEYPICAGEGRRAVVSRAATAGVGNAGRSACAVYGRTNRRGAMTQPGFALSGASVRHPRRDAPIVRRAANGHRCCEHRVE